jgi:hypothetical protein
MIRKALEYLVGLADPKPQVIGGRTYTDKPLSLVKAPKPDSIQVTTLQGILDYIHSNPDDLIMDQNMTLHVVSPTEVHLFSQLDNDRQRHTFISAEALLPSNTLNRFVDVEQFIINLQAGFVQNEDTAKILKCVGNITETAVKQASDDGISQTVTARTGITRVGEIVVPNPVILAPYRTYVEVEQPESKFIFRMKEGPVAGLIEADGGAWKIEAMSRIKSYLTERLVDVPITIIS